MYSQPRSIKVLVKIPPNTPIFLLKQHLRSTKTIPVKVFLEPKCAICHGPRKEDKIIVCPNCLEVYHISCLKISKEEGEWDGACLRCHYPLGDILDNSEYMKILDSIETSDEG